MAISTPLVSIIIPCYNSEKYLFQTLKSVVDQSFKPIEIILINDGSTDGSSEIVQKFPEVIVINQKNQGVSKARNAGISRATGDYIAFLDSDDYFLPENLEKKIQYLQKNPTVVLVHSQEQIVNELGQKLNKTSGMAGRLTEELLSFKQAVIHSPSSVITKKTFLNKAGLFNEKLSTSADWELWIRLSLLGEIGYIEEPLTAYRVHSNQMHHNIVAMEMDMNLAYRLAYNSSIITTKKRLSQLLANLNFTLANSYIGDARNIPQGLKCFIKSLVISPRTFFKRLLRIK